MMAHVYTAIALTILLAAALHAEPVKIGSRLELFVDDFLIERMEGVELTLHKPVPREEVFAFDAPWEGNVSAYVTVFKDGNGYRMYYRGSDHPQTHPEVACVAESADGIVWTRPRLNLYECAGSKDNNIVWMGAGAHAFTPFKDTNPDAKPDQLYKAVGPLNQANTGNALFAFFSPDGYRWERREEPIITKGAFDSQNLAFWDAENKEYVCYFRGFQNGVRDILRSTSRDFITWSDPEWLSFTGAPAEHLYTNAIIPYPRAPHIYMGFPKRFVEKRKVVDAHPFPGVSDGVFMSSRDGLNFHRWPVGFMLPGPDPLNWTDRNVMAAWGMLELIPGEISLYYSQHYRHPTSHMVRATLRTDGFVSVQAKSTPGEFTTRPMTFTGKELTMNFSTSAVGYIRVEIQDADGKAIPGFTMEDCPEIYGDLIEGIVKWKSSADLSSLAGEPIRLRFKMFDADLYSIRFR